MSSGRRESVMIFCASAVKDLYLAPVEHYGPDLVHVFVSDRGDNVSALEREVYGNCKKEIGCKKLVEHPIDTRDYEGILASIIEIKKELSGTYGEDLDIFINISSGTPEFSAAAMFAAMLPEPAIAFRVDTESDLSKEELEDIAGRISSSVRVSEPARVTGLKNDDPEEEMIIFLSIVRELLRETRYPKFRTMIDLLKDDDAWSRYPKFRTMIDLLKDDDAWSYDPSRKSGRGRTSLEDREERYLKRHYIEPALKNGWLEKLDGRRIGLTEQGMAYLSVYGEATVEAPSVCCSLAAPVLRDVCEPEENVVAIEHGGRTYRFRIGLE